MYSSGMASKVAMSGFAVAKSANAAAVESRSVKINADANFFVASTTNNVLCFPICFFGSPVLV